MKNKGTSKRLWQLFSIITIITVIIFIGCSSPTEAISTDGELDRDLPEAESPFTELPGTPSAESITSFSITFISDVESNTMFGEKQEVARNAFIKAPEGKPTKNGLEFQGWIFQEDLSRQVTFKEPIDRDVTLIADWGTDGLRYNQPIGGETSIRTLTSDVDTIVIPSYKWRI